jgi:N-acetylneuraminate synthase
MNEVRESMSAILGKGNPDIILLHCVTNYPAEPAHVNLRCIPVMKAEFSLPVGYSDHTIGTSCCIGAAAIGANVLEKHFTHDKKAEGPDHMLSADTEEMRQIVKNVRTIETAMGDGIKRPSKGERTTRINNRKSIVSVQAIPKGTVITTDMIAIKRPGIGIQPKYFHEVVGRTAKFDIKAEESVLWDYI